MGTGAFIRTADMAMDIAVGTPHMEHVATPDMERAATLDMERAATLVAFAPADSVADTLAALLDTPVVSAADTAAAVGAK
jgi:hypothetical protein